MVSGLVGQREKRDIHDRKPHTEHQLSNTNTVQTERFTPSRLPQTKVKKHSLTLRKALNTPNWGRRVLKQRAGISWLRRLRNVKNVKQSINTPISRRRKRRILTGLKN